MREAYETLSAERLAELHGELSRQYEEVVQEHLSLDMSRGKPAPEQLDLSMNMLDTVRSDNLHDVEGPDVRNYGGLDGIKEAKVFFAGILGVRPSEVMVGGNSSLAMMHDTVARALLSGVYGGEVPWMKVPGIKFICPSPGYDRHFAICEHFNIEMITVDMLEDGPDMDAVERLVREDGSIKGMWCVPRYSNPEGITYSDEVVRRLAEMKAKAPDFRIFWDDAYCVHHLTDEPAELANMLEACREAGNPDRVLMFASTSKVTFPGSGVAVMAASERNLETIRKQVSFQTIGPDKINQLRHVRYFPDKDALHEHMRKHAAIVAPKFDAVLQILDEELGGREIADWKAPKGGYFISLNTIDGCAREVVRLAGEAGITLTKAGATYPYGNDPRDRNIRIAPTYPTLEELKKAMRVLCICVKLASIRKLQETGA
ncbi:aminotransferase class I/II-fold pyridoxal phosphate-dependent enzyme [Paenibacillus sambharensis]|uniref:aminotransferase class I/II-fold pyridoxal phosphate-dependent enzyme n=1 Tax=Paenibacillus sambharensis TaxID=1803190 RepID=UPI0026DA2B39